MAKNIWDASIGERKRIVHDFGKRKLLPEEIARIEKQYGMCIVELACRFEYLLYLRSHCWYEMTLTELRRWNKEKGLLPDEEKRIYADQSGCSYDVFEELASERLIQLEIMSWKKKIRRRKREKKELRSYLQELVEKGKATTTDGKCVSAQ